MANRTVNTNMLTPNKTIMIRGKLTYSRVTKFIDGDELRKDNQRRAQRNLPEISKPYTTASICNATVLYENPNQKTPEDIYAEESLYQSTSPTNTGWNFQGMNKGKILPYIAVMRPDGTTADQIKPEGELAAGLDVTLVLRVFAAKPNNGVGLDGIIVNEPIRYYNGGLGIGLAERGITFNASPDAMNMPTPELDNPMPAPENNYMNPPFVAGQGQPVAAPQMNENPYMAQPTNVQPNYGAQPATPATPPIYGQQMAQNTYEQPTQPQVPVQTPPTQQPAYQQTSVQTPVQSSGFQGSESQGIRYDPSDRGYN